MRLILLSREWRNLIVVAIIGLGVGFLLGRFTASGSRPHDVSIETQTYHTCMYLYRDVAGCAEVMRRLAGDRAEAN
jgi:hypothetical protein